MRKIGMTAMIAWQKVVFSVAASHGAVVIEMTHGADEEEQFRPIGTGEGGRERPHE